MLNSADNPGLWPTHEAHLLTEFHCTSHCTTWRGVWAALWNLPLREPMVRLCREHKGVRVQGLTERRCAFLVVDLPSR
jgi:hypothetical protein